MFHFKHFSISHSQSSMKVGTDAVLLGCLANVSGDSVLEIGCGCGVISLMIAQRFPNVNIMAIDIHKPSVDEALQNFQKSIWNNRLHAEKISLQEFSKQAVEKYDVIISNPPFFSKSLQSPDTDRTNARHTTMLTYEDLILHSEKLLTANGCCSVIIPTSELANFQTDMASSKLHIHGILHVFGADRKKSKRVILECGFEEKTLIEKSFFLYNTEKTDGLGNLDNYTDEYIHLVNDFLKLRKNE